MKIIITGKGGSGKDYLKNKLIDFMFKPDISYTTRPIRNGETNGKEYHFISNEEFNRMVRNRKFYVTNMFNNWKYGISMESWINNDVFIMTPSDIKKMSPIDIKKSVIVYLDIDRETRLKRLMERSFDAERRIYNDEIDFENFNDYIYKVTDPFFNAEDVLHVLITIYWNIFIKYNRNGFI